MLKVSFFDSDYKDAEEPTYVIIGARYKGKWLFVKNRKRGSYEMPAGHIDKNEAHWLAAGRELKEESGARKFTLECVNTYTVVNNGLSQSGKLYFADVVEKGEIEDKDEIEECIERSILPENLTFPEVQSRLFERLEEYVKEKEIKD